MTYIICTGKEMHECNAEGEDGLTGAQADQGTQGEAHPEDEDHQLFSINMIY
jgi:hypothetical protein